MVATGGSLHKPKSMRGKFARNSSSRFIRHSFFAFVVMLFIVCDCHYLNQLIFFDIILNC